MNKIIRRKKVSKLSLFLKNKVKVKEFKIERKRKSNKLLQNDYEKIQKEIVKKELVLEKEKKEKNNVEEKISKIKEKYLKEKKIQII